MNFSRNDESETKNKVNLTTKTLQAVISDAPSSEVNPGPKRKILEAIGHDHVYMPMEPFQAEGRTQITSAGKCQSDRIVSYMYRTSIL